MSLVDQLLPNHTVHASGGGDDCSLPVEIEMGKIGHEAYYKF